MSTAESMVAKPSLAAKPATLADVLESLGVAADRVMARPAPGTATPEDVLAARTEGRLCELVDGVLVEKAMGYYESELAGALIFFLRLYLARNRIGRVAGEAGTLRLPSGLLRMPDVSFIASSQSPAGRYGEEHAPQLAPTLAVEVFSEGNTRGEMDRKLGEYFAAGSKLVWFLDPKLRIVTVHTAPDQSTVLDESGTLEGGDVLPGFRLAIRDWFAAVEDPLVGP